MCPRAPSHLASASQVTTPTNQTLAMAAEPTPLLSASDVAAASRKLEHGRRQPCILQGALHFGFGGARTTRIPFVSHAGSDHRPTSSAGTTAGKRGCSDDNPTQNVHLPRKRAATEPVASAALGVVVHDAEPRSLDGQAGPLGGNDSRSETPATPPPSALPPALNAIRRLFACASLASSQQRKTLTRDYHRHILYGLLPNSHIRQGFARILSCLDNLACLRACVPQHLSSGVDAISAAKDGTFVHSLTVRQATCVLHILHAAQLIREGSPVHRLVCSLLSGCGKLDTETIMAWMRTESVTKARLSAVANSCLKP